MPVADARDRERMNSSTAAPYIPSLSLWAIVAWAVGSAAAVAETVALDNPAPAVIGTLVVTVVVTFCGNLQRAMLIFLASLSAVVVLVQLPFSVLTYLRLDDAVMLLLLVWWVLDRRHRPGGFFGPLKATGLSLPFLGYHVLVLSSLVFNALGSEPSKELGNMLWYCLRQLQAGLVFLVAVSLRRDGKVLRRYAKFVVLAGTVLSFVGVLQYFDVISIRNYLGFADMKYPQSPGWGATSILSENHAHLGGYLVLSSLLALEFVGERHALIWVLLLSTNVAGLVVSLSRASWAALAVGLAIYFRRVGRLGQFLWLVAAVAIVWSFVQESGRLPELEARFGAGEEHYLAQSALGSARWRLRNHEVALRYVEENPQALITGIGFMNWRYEVNRFAQWQSANAHDNFLSVVVELGLMGLAFFVWFWTGAARKALANSDKGVFGARAVGAALVGLIVSCISQETLYPVPSMENFLMFVYVLTGLWLWDPKGTPGTRRDG